MLRFIVFLLCLSSACGFNVMPRRAALQAGLGAAAATLAVPLAPASAKSKASVLPNKVEGVGANAGQYLSQYRKEEYAAMAGDKGSRGVASKEFEKNDTVQKNRDKYKGLAYDNKTGKKIVISDRNPSPESLGLKQWSGN